MSGDMMDDKQSRIRDLESKLHDLLASDNSPDINWSTVGRPPTWEYFENGERVFAVYEGGRQTFDQCIVVRKPRTVNG